MFDIPLLTHPDEYARIAEAQRKYVREIAEKIDNHAPIEGMDALFAAGILRAWADNLPSIEPGRKPGQAPRIDPGDVCLRYEALIRGQNIGKLAAQEELAGEYGVSREAIRGAIRKHGQAAKRFWDFAEKHGKVSYKQKSE